MDSAYHAIPASAGAKNSVVLPRAAIPSRSEDFPQGLIASRSDFQVRLATNAEGQRSNLSMLVRRLYAWKGLDTVPMEAAEERPNQLTLAAYRDESLFGTLTLGMDSPEGLLADQLYGAEIDCYRSSSARVCELIRLAVEPCFNSKEVLASIFHLAYMFGRLIHGMTDLFIEVNPRHVGFYKHMLGFHEIGEEKICPRVNAPARLLHLALDYVDQQIVAHAGRPPSVQRSLYAHFFPLSEQLGLLHRLQRESGLTTN